MLLDLVKFAAAATGAWRRLQNDSRGNIAIFFALSILPVVLAAGAAVDYERAISAKTHLLASLDSAALYAANLTDTDPVVLTTKSQPYVQSNYHNNDDAQLKSYAVTTSGQTVTATGTVQLTNYFMAVVGINTTSVTTSSTAIKSGAKLQVAMVLDNTGSMAQSGKIGAEITASTNLLTQLSGLAINPTDIFVSIIPFDVTVNVGQSNVAANWVTWNDYGTCDKGAGSPNTQKQCSLNGGNWTLSPVSARASWTGCVTDRGNPSSVSAGNFDVNDSPPVTTDTTSMYPAINSSCPQQAMGLSNDWSDMQTVINNMQPGANTNQNLGLQMGWMSLSGGGPFTIPALNPNANYTKAIVLLTDGLNTADRWYTSVNSINARETQTCTAMKAAGIVIYAVQVSTDGTAKSSLLQSCVSDPGNFFYLTSANQVITAFSSIGNNLAGLYLSH